MRAAILNLWSLQKSACDLFFDFWGRFGVYEGCHEGLEIGDDKIGSNRSDVFEEAFFGALGLTGLDRRWCT